ncbi:hypothetical protein AB4Y89_05005 [Terriglobus sp. 2YAB30_2]|uniref:hypothetical protein n=1 Tax=Terriglobus sp. 2YAB30_2 TaxID=3233023 RepID=UPI003F99D54F
MKKVLFASFLAAAAVAVSPIALVAATANVGQAQGGGVQMSQEEYNAYDAATKTADPKAKIAALQAYLDKYPQSTVKESVLELIMGAYGQLNDAPGVLSAADKLLQVNPQSLRALTMEMSLHKTMADQKSDPAEKQAELDKAADAAKKALSATKGKDIDQATWDAMIKQATPYLYSAIASAALNKKDTATAIDNYKKELAAVPVEQTATPGPFLQDTFFLGLAYLQSTPPDYVNCTWYTTRFVEIAPEPYKSQYAPTAKYCYTKYHGKADGYETVQAAVKSSLNPPADFKIDPAPSPADIVAQTISSTPDLSTLALSDREFILAYGKKEDADKMWAVLQGKDVKIPDVVVVEATGSVIKGSVSDDAVQSKAADFTFNLKEPLTKVPAVGDKIVIAGTYDSYTQSPGQAVPVMIIMKDAMVEAPKKTPAKPAAKAPVHHAPARKK